MKIIKDIKKYLKTVSPYLIVLLVMFFWIMYLTECRGDSEPKTNTVFKYETDTVIQYDTTIIEKINYIPKWYEKIVYVPTLTPVDTSKIIEDYFTAYLYADTTINDTSAFMAIYDSIYMNQITSRTYKFINRRPTTQIITNTTIVKEKPEWNIGLGGFFGGTTERFDVGAGIIVSSKNNAMYGLEYCFIDKSIRLKLYYNLRK